MPTPVLVYDGDCGFCSRTAEWAEARLPDAEVQPYQWLDLEPLGLTPEDGKRAAWWIDERGRRHRGHRGAGRALIAMGGLWRVPGTLMLVPPFSWLAAGVYALVARFRYKLPGGTPACRLPRG
jgi:predicted DCC family thiol-disulfide oxidoreductase YuxK